MKPLRFTFLSTMDAEPWGGSEELWQRTALRLRAEGHAVRASVAEWNPAPAPIAALIAAGVAVRQRPRFVRFWERGWRSLRGQSGAHREFQWLADSRPDLLVISQGGNSEGAAWHAGGRLGGLPYAVIVHAAAEIHWPHDSLARQMKDMYEGAGQVYFVSTGNLELTRRQTASELAGARIVRNPFNVDRASAPAWPLEQPFVVASAGRMEIPSKGQDILFDVLRAAKWRERPVTFRLFGRGRHEQGLRRLKDYWKLDHVEFGGFVDRPEKIWESCHALVLASRLEGLPLVVVEAMMCGRPCIVTDIAGNTEAIEDNETGFVASSPTAEALDAALERAWTRRADWRAMGQEAARRIRSLIPPDPVQAFADELKRLAAGQ